MYHPRGRNRVPFAGFPHLVPRTKQEKFTNYSTVASTTTKTRKTPLHHLFIYVIWTFSTATQTRGDGDSWQAHNPRQQHVAREKPTRPSAIYTRSPGSMVPSPMIPIPVPPLSCYISSRQTRIRRVAWHLLAHLVSHHLAQQPHQFPGHTRSTRPQPFASIIGPMTTLSMDNWGIPTLHFPVLKLETIRSSRLLHSMPIIFPTIHPSPPTMRCKPTASNSIPPT